VLSLVSFVPPTSILDNSPKFKIDYDEEGLSFEGEKYSLDSSLLILSFNFSICILVGFQTRI